MQDLAEQRKLRLAPPPLAGESSRDGINKARNDQSEAFYRCEAVIGGVKYYKDRVFQDPAGQDSQKAKPLVDVMAGACCHFENCQFIGAQKVAFAARTGSVAFFKGCSFINCKNAILVCEGSKVSIENCRFGGIHGLGAYGYRRSELYVDGCEFTNIDNKAILCLEGSQGYVSRCTFKGVNSGCVVAGESSWAHVRDSNMSEANGPAMSAMRKSVLTAQNCTVSNVKGNGLAFVNSTGYASGVEITNSQYPAIVICGRQANPVIKNCKISECDMFGVSVREYASPTIEDVTVSGAKGAGISISEFSEPLIRNCSVSNVQGSGISVFNGARAAVEKVELQNCERDCDSFMRGTILDKPRECPNRSEGISWQPAKIDSLTNNSEAFDLPVFQIPDGLPSPQKLITVQNEDHSFHCTCSHRCVNCGAETKFVADNCGHRLCEKCKTSSTCPKCHTMCTRLVQVFEEEECVICCSAKSSRICLPCGHKCLCAECASQLIDDGGANKCPLCAQQLRDTKADYSYEDSA